MESETFPLKGLGGGPAFHDPPYHTPVRSSHRNPVHLPTEELRCSDIHRVKLHHPVRWIGSSKRDWAGPTIQCKSLTEHRCCTPRLTHSINLGKRAHHCCKNEGYYASCSTSYFVCPAASLDGCTFLCVRWIWRTERCIPPEWDICKAHRRRPDNWRQRFTPVLTLFSAVDVIDRKLPHVSVLKPVPPHHITTLLTAVLSPLSSCP